MCPFYNAQLFEITGAAKGVFTHSQSSCHIAKVVLTIRRDSRQIPLAARHHTFPHRGFLHWRFAYAGPGVRRATVMGPASANLHGRPWAWGARPYFSVPTWRLKPGLPRFSPSRHRG